MSDRTQAHATFEDFWKDLVCDDQGRIDEEKVKLELDDYYRFMDEVAIVYCHVTNDLISKPNTMAFEVCAVADDQVNKLVEEEVNDRATDLGFEDWHALKFFINECAPKWWNVGPLRIGVSFHLLAYPGLSFGGPFRVFKLRIWPFLFVWTRPARTEVK